MEEMVTAKYSKSEVTTGDVFIPQLRKLSNRKSDTKGSEIIEAEDAKGSEKTCY